MKRWLLPVIFAALVAVCGLVGPGRAGPITTPCDLSNTFCFYPPALGFATAVPTAGVGLATAGPVAVSGATWVNSGASAVFCGLYNQATAATLSGTPTTLIRYVEVGAGATQPVYIPPTTKQFFTTGLAYGCSTTFLGTTAVAQTTVWLDVSF